ncbi:MAG: TIGR00159 family protein [Cytophagales bacterium]|nr:MAG: TIGR00159 family protein [Cytophagales bacterium]
MPLPYLEFLEIGWLDVLDIALVAVLLYQIYNLVRGSIASRVFIGYLLVYLVYLVVKALRLQLLTTILEYFISVGALALIIIFQQEIRRFLLLIGKSTNAVNNQFIRRWLLRQPVGEEPLLLLKPVLDATKVISEEFSGGLLVIQKNDDLEKFAQSGEAINADLSKTLLLAIFGQYSPLHDGAVVLSGGRIRAARCILPVSDDADIPASLGFRHRAGIGMSEVTDAAVIVVSEETGRISLAIDGELSMNMTLADLETRLQTYLKQPAPKATR